MAEQIAPKPAGMGRVALIAVLALLAVIPSADCRKRGPAVPSDPRNVPAEVKVDGDGIVLSYLGEEVVSARVDAAGGVFTVETNVFRSGRGGAVTNVIAVRTVGDGARPAMRIGVKASPESFPCEADRSARGPVMVRHVSGVSRSLLNRAVYDRKDDWLLSVDAGPHAVVLPKRDDGKTRAYEIEAAGREIIIRFKPAYYRVHRGLEFFKPWTYAIWPKPVAGWISWFAFYDKVSERDIIETADTVSKTLLPYGYDYLQIDDGYQKGLGLPELWLNANDKFPKGLAWLASYIKGKGLRPGIWTGVSFKQTDFVAAHKDWFVTGPDGEPASGSWVYFSLDASNDAALNGVVRPIYKGLKEMGWEYFKVDALRHLRYEGYNSHSGYFAGKKIDLTGTFRKYVETVREEIGRDNFMLGCWGIRPELIGIIDGCRIGDDGFSYAGLAQYNSWNNVVWRNDPDHIELNEDRFRSLLVTSLTGSTLLLTDKPELYRTDAVDAARRAAPVLWTVPGQTFDVDPSRSGLLAQVNTEVSGAGPRPFDAGYQPACDLWLLEVVRPFERWLVLGRTGDSEPEIRFADLGLDQDREYLVFEFWTKRPVGSFIGGFMPGRLDNVFRSQCFIIRERRPEPQVAATGRHLTGGGVDLLDERWADGKLSGRSLLVAGDPYEIYVNIPAGFDLGEVKVDGARFLGVAGAGPLRVIKLVADQSGEAAWNVSFTR